MKDLKGKTAFITGGVSGIGLGFAKALAEAGMKVAITYRRPDHRDEAMAWFDGHPGQTVLPVKLDVTDRAAWPGVIDEVEARLGPIQLLCNNAGVGVIGPMEQATFADWDWVMGVNVGGVINGIMTVVPRMIAHGQGGHVVNVSSVGGIAALGTAGIYITSKFAVVGMSEALWGDLQPYGIGVSVYCPGPVKSNIGEAGKMRPAELAESGYRPPVGPDAQPIKGSVNFGDAAMDADEAGRRMLDAIRRDELYILTHPELRDAIAERHRALEAAWPDEPINQARAATIPGLLTTLAYTEHGGRKPS